MHADARRRRRLSVQRCRGAGCRDLGIAEADHPPVPPCARVVPRSGRWLPSGGLAPWSGLALMDGEVVLGHDPARECGARVCPSGQGRSGDGLRRTSSRRRSGRRVEPVFGRASGSLGCHLESPQVRPPGCGCRPCRGLLWAFDDVAFEFLEAALHDDAWRVREMAVKEVARPRLEDLLAAVAGLQDDPVVRVRAAASRAFMRLAARGR
jgi:hypothetical protein